MKSFAALVSAFALALAALALVPPAVADHGYPPHIPTSCQDAGASARPTTASIRVVAQSNKQPSGTVRITIEKRRSGKVVRSAKARFAKGRRVTVEFRQLRRGRYVVRFSAAASHFWQACSASRRLRVR